VHPVPTPAIDPFVDSVLGGDMRINEPTVGAPPNSEVVAVETVRFLSLSNGPPAQEREHQVGYSYVVGQRSQVPVPFEHANPSAPPSPVVMLPRGLVINATTTHTNHIAPFATLADDGRTLSVGETLGLRRHLATYVKRPMTRTARIEPLNREVTFAPTLQGEESDPESITVVNDGRDPLLVHSFVVFANGSGFSRDYLVRGSCADVTRGALPPGERCEFEVVFNPQLTYRTGERTETLTIRTNAGSTSGFNFTSTTFFLSGEATGAPQLTIDPPAATFLDTRAGQSSVPQTFSVRNSGDLRLTVDSIHLDSPDFFIDVSTCSVSFLNPAENCVFSVVFRPAVHGETLARAASLTLTTNSGSTGGSSRHDTAVPLAGVAAYARPIAEAGPDQHGVTPNTNVVLDGRASSDPQGLALTFSWAFSTRPLGSHAVLLDTASPAARFVPDVDGTYIVTLEVSNLFVTSVTDSVFVHVAVAPPPPPPPAGPPPRVTGVGELTLAGSWTVRFFGGDDDEEFWMRIGNQQEFPWEEDETPGRVVVIDFRPGEGIVRFAEEENGEGMRPLTIELLSDGRYLLHLRDDDPPNEIELTLVLERVTLTP
jgi:hypothetical protein